MPQERSMLMGEVRVDGWRNTPSEAKRKEDGVKTSGRGD